ncbi:hypothetical protein RY972_05920 [Aeromonas allosaccharophila]|uniref:Uncharacterized protein n=1 Tax=Aeromonas allosaccharophila TaxID=656 RepID=A0ABZ0FDE0_9GAMM|nr:hypothetical protein [Aeromonas allosaccharophila]WOE67603.1 hypothetical protein RY972_05920 [Aeromonas allosaccharophila]
MTLSKPKWKTLLLSSPLLVLLLGSTLLLVNNFGCNYEMTIQSQGVDYRGVCRWGRFREGANKRENSSRLTQSFHFLPV